MITDGKKLHLIGNAHLDPVWLWRWQEGYAEIKATFRSALDRMNEFSEFIFTCACAAYYEWVEKNCPEMFMEIKQRVKEGRWVIVGGWWIQPDCNLPSGESFARHGLYSQRYFQEKFGVMARVGYNVDSFGHNGMLPQILKKSGMDYYVFMRPDENENNRIPNLFLWESEDGSRVTAFKIPSSYANFWVGKMEAAAEGSEVKQKIISTMKLAEEQGDDFMVFYGVGNHGGGPTIANIKHIIEAQDRFGKERVLFSSPNEYFDELRKQENSLPVFKEDLQHTASGCYSTHSEVKKNNRKAEHRLLIAEKYTAIAHHLLGHPDRQAEIRDVWKNILFNQFHDIICGCSIKEAYDDVRELYGESLSRGAKILNDALQKISWSINTVVEDITCLDKEDDSRIWEKDNKGVPVVIFNPLSWPVTAPIEVNKTVRKVTDETGEVIEIQHVRGAHTQELYDKWHTVFNGYIPAMGYRIYWIYRALELPMFKPDISVDKKPNILENDYMLLEIEPHTGYLSRLFDKKNQVEVLASKGAVPVVIDEYHCDTWAHGIFEFREQIGTFADAKVELLEDGPICGRIRVENRYNNSVLQQDFILYKNSPDIEVRVKLDWREKHKMLKLSFPVNAENPKAVYEIPYGFIERPVNGEEEPGQQWLDVSGTLCNKTVGLALLNDCKYSFDVKGNDMRMTVVRSPIFADHGDPRDRYCEFMDQGIQEFKYKLVPHSGDWTSACIIRKAYEFNIPPVQIIETYHKGQLPQRFEGINISSCNIIATVFKKAEDGIGYVVRCYETNGMETETTIEIPMLERKWTAMFLRCEIKTFWIPDNKSEEVQEKNLLEF